MKAEIVSVGTELLLGEIVNTNAPFLARRLAELGIDSYFQTTVGDNPERIAGVLSRALARSDLVLTSGGLGPTMDDATREAIAAVMGRPLELEPRLLQALEGRFAGQGRPVADNVRRQAYVPQGAAAIPNAHGTAPGLYLETEQGILVALPGPPRELEPMVDRWLVPRLRDRFDLLPLCTRTLHTTGLGESQVEARLDDLIRQQDRVTIATYARPGHVSIRLAVKAADEAAAASGLDPLEEAIRARLGEAVYGRDAETLAGVVGALLVRRGETLAVAESCSGGLLASRITDVPGSSRYFLGGVVAYANAAKERQLGVPPEILARHGAVSAATAEAMAQGAASAFDSDWALAITGIAGPSGGSREKPVGTVFIAWAHRDAGGLRAAAQRQRFPGTRRENVRASVREALDLLRRRLA